MLERVAEVMARGDSITVVSVSKELTTQQAADLLNVSRQYLVRLLDEKRLPFTKTGKHRRLRIEDVLAFKENRDRNRSAGMRELSQLTQELGGYDAELLVSTGTMPEDRVDRLRAIMDREFPEAEATGYEDLIDAMQNDPKDRHVVAVAVKASA